MEDARLAERTGEAERTDIGLLLRLGRDRSGRLRVWRHLTFNDGAIEAPVQVSHEKGGVPVVGALTLEQNGAAGCGQEGAVADPRPTSALDPDIALLFRWIYPGSELALPSTTDTLTGHPNDKCTG